MFYRVLETPKTAYYATMSSKRQIKCYALSTIVNSVYYSSLTMSLHFYNGDVAEKLGSRIQCNIRSERNNRYVKICWHRYY